MKAESGLGSDSQAGSGVEQNHGDMQKSISESPLPQGHHFEATTVSGHAVVHQGDQNHHHLASQYNVGNTHFGNQYHFGPSVHFHGIDAAMHGDASVTSSTSRAQADAQKIKHVADQITLDNTYINKVVEWLAPGTQFNYHEDIRSKVYEDTGKWISDDENIERWLQGWKKTLVLSGMAGCGKTCIASILIDFVRSQNAGDLLVLFFYNNFKRQAEQRTREIMASLLQQALGADPSRATYVLDLYSRYKRLQSRPTTKELATSLCNVTNQYRQTIIIFDAFDECVCTDAAPYSQRNEFWERLTVIQQHSPKNVSILVTTRPEMGPRLGVSSTMTLQAHPEDVSEYVSQRLKYADNTAELSSSLHQQIQDRIVECSNGM